MESVIGGGSAAGPLKISTTRRASASGPLADAACVKAMSVAPSGGDPLFMLTFGLYADGTDLVVVVVVVMCCNWDQPWVDDGGRRGCCRDDDRQGHRSSRGRDRNELESPDVVVDGRSLNQNHEIIQVHQLSDQVECDTTLVCGGYQP